MKNKKATSFMWGVIIFGVIGFLIVLILFGSQITQYITTKVPNIIPGFNTDKPPLVKMDLLRYNIGWDTIQYNEDGINWLDFPQSQPAELNGKILDWEQTRRAFAEDYFYKPNARTPLTISLNPKYGNVYTEPEMPLDYCLIFDTVFKKLETFWDGGDIGITLAAERNKICAGEMGWFILTPNQKLEFTKINVERYIETGKAFSDISSKEDITNKRPELFREINELGITWRDSILANPMPIHYKDSQGNTKCILVKVEKITNPPHVYLKANLAEPVGEC